jgi:hypothetical protein
MNIPLCKYCWDIYEFENSDWGDIRKIKKFISENNPKNLSIIDWIRDTTDKIVDGKTESVTNEDKLEEAFPNIYLYKKKVTSRFSHMWKDTEISCGVIVQEPDKDGLFSYLDSYSKDESICIILKQKNNFNLYNKGIL